MIRTVSLAIMSLGFSIGFVSANRVLAHRSPGQAAQAEAAKSMEGVVLTPDDKPVKGAAVFWLERDSEGYNSRKYTVSTDASGRFSFPKNAPKLTPTIAVTLMVQALDWGIGFKNLRFDGDANRSIRLTLQPATIVTIPITDAFGKPIPNLPVQVKFLNSKNINFLQIPEDVHGIWEQKTNLKGEAVFRGLPQGALIRLSTISATYANPDIEDAISLSLSAQQTAPPIKLTLGATLQGRVIDEQSGKPVQGIQVGVQSADRGNGYGASHTDSDGNYRISKLTGGAYNISIRFTEEQQKTRTARAIEKVNLKQGERLTDQNLRLIKGSLVTGKVTDKTTGKPIPGARIGVYGPANPRSSSAVLGVETNQNGDYAARVPSGVEYVYVMGLPADQSERYQQPKGEGESVTLGENAVATQDFTLTPSILKTLKSVHGKVLGADGKPIPGAIISVNPVYDQRSYFRDSEGQSDANGLFTLPMSTASARIRAFKGKTATLATTLAQSGDEITLQLQPHALINVSGVVEDQKGKPISGAKVMIVEWWLDTGRSGAVIATDSQGRYQFSGLYPDAGYSVHAGAPGFGEQGSYTLHGKPGQGLPFPTLKLIPAKIGVGGRVVDENGESVAKQLVAMDGRNSRHQEKITDSKGRFKFTGAVKELLRLTLRNDDGYFATKEVTAGEMDVILIRKTPKSKTDVAKNDLAVEMDKRLKGLLMKPGPALVASAWLNTQDNKPLETKGKIVLLDFWAINCGPCVANLPAVEKASKLYAENGVVVVGVHSSGMEVKALSVFLKEHGVTFPIAVDTQSAEQPSFGQIMNSYGVQGIPTVVVLDRKGVVRIANEGLEGAMNLIAELLAVEKK